MNDTLLSLKTIIPVKPEGLEAVRDLFDALHVNRIQYCHWKSNIRLDHSLKGKTDLDLLVNRSHSQALRQVLLEQNIKPISPPPGQQYPGLEHYLGFDHSTGRLFHLHIHYQLVLGEQYIKNFRLPLEEVFLKHTQNILGIKVPLPELELGILIIRVLLKYRFRDAIKDVFSIKSPGIKKAFLDEINWLLNQTSFEDIDQTLSELAPILPSQIILEFLKTIQEEPRNGLKFVSLQRRIRKAIHAYQRQDLLSASFHYLKEQWRRRKTFFQASPSTGLKLPQGGITIAMLGADGAGKSTLCSEISEWLSWKLDVKNFYLGSKQPSLMSQYLYQLFRLFRKLHRKANHSLSERHIITRSFHKLMHFILFLHHLSIGRDRVSRYEKGTRYATDGSVVIFDRFPISSFKMATNTHLLDGPHIQELSKHKETVMSNRLSVIEQQIYKKIDTPDVLVFLNVSPEVSIQRKPDHQEAVIRLKSKTIADLAEQISSQPFAGTSIQINADRSYDQVLLQIKRELWIQL